MRITVWECQQGLGGLASGVNVWAGDWEDSGSGANMEFTVPGAYQRVGWSVNLPQGWSAASTRGEAGVGASINVVATSPACFVALDPRTPLPGMPTLTPTPIFVPPCSGTYGPRGSHIAVAVPGAGAQIFGNTLGFDRYNLPLDPWAINAPTVPAAAPITARFNFDTLSARNFEADHTGMADVRIFIRDVTSQRDLLLLTSSDDKEWPAGRGLRITAQAGAGLDFGGSFLFWNLSNGSWGFPSNAPRNGWFIRAAGGEWQVTFVPKAGHRYVVASSAAHDACRPDYAMWSVAVVQAECTDGICPTPLPAPSAQPLPTPLPPPQPPAAQGEIRLWMHSEHDPDNGVYRSDGTTVAWPQGEILDFAPAVTLAPLPLPQPPLDPFWGSRYSFQQEVVGWSYVTAAVCRGAGKPAATLKGCAYAYVAEPSAAQIAAQARALWAGGNEVPLPPDVYGTTMGSLQPVDLPLEVLVETRTLDANGMVLLRRLTTLPATFRVELVAPRSVR